MVRIADGPASKGVQSDLISVFRNIGVSHRDSDMLADNILVAMGKPTSLAETEREVHFLLQNAEASGQPFRKALDVKQKGRVDTIAIDQIAPYLDGREGRRVNGKILDFGAGSGEIADILQKRYHLKMVAADIRDFRNSEIEVPFQLLDGDRLPVDNNHFQGVVCSAVLHHSASPDRLIEEISRAVWGKAVVIETIPEDITDEVSRLRVLAQDILWNRFFHDADIPVPGSYDSPDGWVKRFERHGWVTHEQKELGYDLEVARVRHHLMVFEKLSWL